jgi:hypothetical protein
MPLPKMPLIWNPLDPLGSLVKVMQDAYSVMVGVFEQIIASPPRFSNISILSVLYWSGSHGAASLSYMVLLFAVVIGALFFHKGMRIGQALLVYLLLAGATIPFVAIIDQLTLAGDEAAAAMNFYTPPDGATGYAIPFITDPIWWLAGMFGGLVGGSWLAGLIMAYEPLIILAKFIGLPMVALSTVGTRSRNVANALLAVTLVATCVGRPFAVFFLELGQVALYTAPFGTTPIGASLYTNGSYVSATISQLVLMAACYKAAVVVEGKIAAAIKGTAEATIRKVLKVDIRKQARQADSRPVPVVVMTPIPTLAQQAHGTARVGVADAKRKAAHFVTQAAAGAVAVAGSPAAGAVIHKAGGAFFGDNQE